MYACAHVRMVRAMRAVQILHSCMYACVCVDVYTYIMTKSTKHTYQDDVLHTHTYNTHKHIYITHTHA